MNRPHPVGRAGKLTDELALRAAIILTKGYKQLEIRLTLLTLPVPACIQLLETLSGSGDLGNYVVVEPKLGVLCP